MLRLRQEPAKDAHTNQTVSREWTVMAKKNQFDEVIGKSDISPEGYLYYYDKNDRDCLVVWAGQLPAPLTATSGLTSTLIAVRVYPSWCMDFSASYLNGPRKLQRDRSRRTAIPDSMLTRPLLTRTWACLACLAEA